MPRVPKIPSPFDLPGIPTVEGAATREPRGLTTKTQGPFNLPQTPSFATQPTAPQTRGGGTTQPTAPTQPTTPQVPRGGPPQGFVTPEGSFVNTESQNYKIAAAMQFADEKQNAYWQSLPWSWRIYMAIWDRKAVNDFVSTMAHPELQFEVDGRAMPGDQAGTYIAQKYMSLLERSRPYGPQQRRLTPTPFRVTA